MNLDNLQQMLMSQWLKLKQGGQSAMQGLQNGLQGTQQASQQWQQNVGNLAGQVQNPWQQQSPTSFLPTKDYQNRMNGMMDSIAQFFKSKPAPGK